MSATATPTRRPRNAARGQRDQLHARLMAADSDLGRAYRAMNESLTRLEGLKVGFGRTRVRQLQDMFSAVRGEIDRTTVRIRFAMAQLRTLLAKAERSAD